MDHVCAENEIAIGYYSAHEASKDLRAMNRSLILHGGNTIFQSNDIYEYAYAVTWTAPDPSAAITQYLQRVQEFVTKLSIKGLSCNKEQIAIGGTLFGRASADALITTLQGSTMYCPSFGMAYGPRSAVFATIRCMSGGFLTLPGGNAYEKARSKAQSTLKAWVTFFHG